MSFSDTYANEVLLSRRVRAQRAGFWAKVVSVLLMITIAAALRSEPQLRLALMGAATDAVLKLSGKAVPDTVSPLPLPSGNLGDLAAVQAVMAKAQSEGRLSMPQSASDTAHGPVAAVRVNRPGANAQTGPQFKSALPTPQGTAAPAAQVQPSGDAAGMAAQLGALLQQLGVAK